ncbi:efflux RND transporter periplasmic adaptor subunit [Parafilimonas sp.]|uniref:efflux RND transporter periplasmic adaptor subunit n=1 Tax=Parafilimonas sp. TaxID=1969739 RepID=UPI0039E5FE63
MNTNRYYTGIALLLLLASCSGRQQNNNTTAQAKSYKVATVQPDTVTLYNDFPAVIQGEKVVEIRPKIDGYVEKIYVDEGAAVRKGQLLFRISNPQYEQDLRSAEASVKTAEANLATAQMTVNKVQPLVEKDIISKYELESAAYDLAAKKAALAEARAAVANARTNVGYTVITSPMNGVIGLLPNKEGSYISSSSTDPLTTISSSGNMYAYFSLNEKQLLDLSRTVKGATLQEKLKQFPPVELILSDGSLYTEKGRVETASGIVTTETGSVSFRATFPNPLGILKTGTSGNVRMPRTIDSALVIPQSATYDLQDKHFVYVVASDSTVKSTTVDVTPTPDGQSYVVNSGLKAGDVISLQGTNELKDGEKIIPERN